MLAGPAGCLRSRWRSSPWKWRNDATPRSRGQKAPSTRRCIKTTDATIFKTATFGQKAPSTRRCIKTNFSVAREHVDRQKALNTRRCIKTSFPTSSLGCLSQKAPSTRRCIKTDQSFAQLGPQPQVRKHPAPEGALRRVHDCLPRVLFLVRKHPAPEGALRRHRHVLTRTRPRCQKAPSIRRPIDGTYSPSSSP